ncbi:MAG: hypothetical protein JST84_24940 [Acidobacteria bacterium]|nr:hypothetical protein [Acidobacteriota bacterium]
MKTEEMISVRGVLRSLMRHPFKLLVVRWNWKSALLSSVIRASIFFVVNVSAGMDAALTAMNTEFLYRACTAGFYAALTQSFRHARPAWQATLTAMVLLPLVSHSIELFVHWLRGTPKLAVSILASACFTAISTAYNLFAMRHGALIVGRDAHTLFEDLRHTPGILGRFIYLLVVELPATCQHSLRHWWMKRSSLHNKEHTLLQIPQNGEFRMEGGE